MAKNENAIFVKAQILLFVTELKKKTRKQQREKNKQNTTWKFA